MKSILLYTFSLEDGNFFSSSEIINLARETVERRADLMSWQVEKIQLISIEHVKVKVYTFVVFGVGNH